MNDRNAVVANNPVMRLVQSRDLRCVVAGNGVIQEFAATDAALRELEAYASGLGLDLKSRHFTHNGVECAPVDAPNLPYQIMPSQIASLYPNNQIPTGEIIRQGTCVTFGEPKNVAAKVTAQR